MTLTFQEQTIHRTVLKNGMVVIVFENPTADIIAGRLFLRVGSSYEPRHHAGVFNLIASVLTKGTEQLSSMDIAERVESIGASLGADTASDYSLISFKTVSADYPDILDLVAQLLRTPTFPEHEVELEKRLTLQSLRSMHEQPFAMAYQNLRQALYGDHPYALSGLGTEETITQFDRDLLQHYHQTYFRPDNMIFSLVGRIGIEDAIASIEQAFGDWQPTTPCPDRPVLPALPNVPDEPTLILQAQETQQSIIMVGYPATSVHNEDYVVLKLLNTYLGNGLSSRLFTELREKQGLAYEVSAFYPTRLDTSHFVAYMGTAPQNTAVALAGLRSELEQLCTTPLEAEALQAAKNKLLGQYALGKQTNSQIAQVYGWYETLGLGLEFDQTFQTAISDISIEDAQQVACRYFQQPYISLLGPEAVLNSLQH
ncbi:MAG: M16 family metallopeptidase [Thainema sp.]